MTAAIDLAQVLSTFQEPWSPRTVATLNDYDVRVVKTQGEFTRHSHPDTDELFLVLQGSLTLRLDSGDVHLGPGQVFVVPRGVRHQPVSVDGAEVVLIEPSATVNTGDTPSHLTAERRVVADGEAHSGHELYRQWLDEVWGGQPGAAQRLVDPGFVGHWPDREVHGPAELAATVAETRGMFTTVDFALEVGPVADGDLVAARWTGTGRTAEATVRFTGNDLLRVADGRVVEYWPATSTLP
jgi:mannose-6-phosphate isomerase-like protein (cupin superfamily)/predicted SnoaL-like aldol condensation-catalyzing enzyme